MSENVWYFTQNGERKGPVTLEVLKNAAANGRLHKERDLVWGPNLQDWTPVEQVPDLQGAPIVHPPIPPEQRVPELASSENSNREATEKNAVDEKPAVNPYATPQSIEEDDALAVAMAERRAQEQGGVGRVVYWILPSVVSSVLGFVVGFFSQETFVIYVAAVCFIIWFLVFILLTLGRLRHVGMSRWTIFWGLVPIMNIWLGFRLYACPAGYEQDRKLDAGGIVAVTLYVLSTIVLIVYFVAVLFVGASYYKKAADEAAKRLDAEKARIQQVE